MPKRRETAAKERVGECTKGKEKREKRERNPDLVCLAQGGSLGGFPQKTITSLNKCFFALIMTNEKTFRQNSENNVRSIAHFWP